MKKLFTIIVTINFLLSCGTSSKSADNVPSMGTSFEQISENETYVVKGTWDSEINSTDTSALTVEIELSDGSIPEIEEFVFLPFMTIHGHPGELSKQLVVKNEEIPNQYSITGFKFTMDGPWDLIFTVTIDGKEEKAVYTMEVE